MRTKTRTRKGLNEINLINDCRGPQIRPFIKIPTRMSFYSAKNPHLNGKRNTASTEQLHKKTTVGIIKGPFSIWPTKQHM